MLSLAHITKKFGQLLALDQVSATFRPGTIHAVLGENGAGKTTLMRVAAGLLRPDAGTIRIDETELPQGDPVASNRAGIAMVHQHFMLVPTLGVVDNCLIGRRDCKQFVSRRRAARHILEIARRTGLAVDPFARIDALSVGQQQRVEIIRALGQARRVLILDEPTAVLAPHEVDQLFGALDQLRRDGLAIVFITHKLAEVERICDELTILRRGRGVFQGAVSTLNRQQMVEHLVGPGSEVHHDSLPTIAVEKPQMTSRPAAGEAVLELDDVHVRRKGTQQGLDDVQLTLRAGEILGIAGVEGNGQDLLAAVIAGVKRPESGRIILNGQDVTSRDVGQRAGAGLAHIAEDRLRQALVPAMTLPENLLLKSYRSKRFARAGFISWTAVQHYAAGQLSKFDVRFASISSEARQLSGGNQQKLVLARELSGEPCVIVAHNPVRGLDLIATQFVFDQLREQQRRGAGILLIHSDLDELLALSDRVAVLYRGRLTLTDWPDCDRVTIGRLMAGDGA